MCLVRHFTHCRIFLKSIQPISNNSQLPENSHLKKLPMQKVAACELKNQLLTFYFIRDKIRFKKNLYNLSLFLFICSNQVIIFSIVIIIIQLQLYKLTSLFAADKPCYLVAATCSNKKHIKYWKFVLYPILYIVAMKDSVCVCTQKGQGKIFSYFN